jgi:hypothetical protein
MSEELKEIAEKEISLLQKRKEKESELLAAKEQAGNEYLSGGRARIGKTVKLRGELDAIDAAITSNRAKRGAAIKHNIEVQAAEKRKQIVAKESELAELAAKVEKHILALRELEQVPYTAGLLSSQQIDPMLPAAGYHAPLSSKLAGEIQQKKKELAELERWKLPEAGSLNLDDATSMDELLLAVLQHPSDVPTAESILEWHELCQAQSLKPFGNLVRRVNLEWESGQINRERSSIFVRDLAKKIEGRFTGINPEHAISADQEFKPPSASAYDVASGTFKAIPNRAQPVGGVVHPII